MKKVLVTGNLGYIGSVMVEHLLGAGFDVTGLDNGFYAGYTLVPRSVEATRIVQITKDIRDVTAADMKGFDAVVHLAALSNDPLGDLKPDLTYEINFRASEALARSAKKAGVPRFVYASSCSLYGKGDDGLRTEKSPMGPITPYAESKVMTETALVKLADRDFCPVLLRNATVMGVSPKMRFDVVVNSLCGFAHTGGIVKVLSDGMPWRPNVDIHDVSRAFEFSLLAPADRVRAEAFNVGMDENNMRVKDIAKIVGDVFGAEVQIVGTTNNDPRSYKVDFGKIRNVMSFSPEWTIERTVRDIHKTFTDYGLSKAQFESEYFTTLKRVKALLASRRIGEDLRWKETSN